MRMIDCHTHVAPDKADLAVRIMDAAGIESAVTCEWYDGFGKTLAEHMAVFNGRPGRFHVFGNIDFSAVDSPHFADKAVENLRRGVEAGMRGLKVYKDLGLGYRDRSGALLRVDDERLDPVWAAAGELGVPVLLHTADPPEFWQPIDEHSAWSQVLRVYSDWYFYRKGYPSRDELLAERNAVVRRHPNTKFIAPHLASMEDEFILLAETLEKLPNLYADISARMFFMGSSERRRRAARDLCIEFADRMLFGTDMILLSQTSVMDIQPQTFMTADRLPAHLAGAGDEMLCATSVWFYECHRRFLATAEVIRSVPFMCNNPQAVMLGLDLPKDVLEKVCGENIRLLLGSISLP